MQNIQWNLDLTKSQGAGEIGLLYQGFIISGVCFH